MGCKRISFLIMILLLMNLSLEKIYAKGKASKKAAAEIEKESAVEENFGIENTANYYVVQGKRNSTKVMQRLTWHEIPDIKCYKIAIEKKEDDGEYIGVVDEEIETNYIEVSLEPGEYRFEVTVINLFNRKKKSGWKNFTVLKAYIPNVKSVSPSPIYANVKKIENVLTIEGENFLPDSVFRMKKIGGEDDTTYKGKIISISEDATTAQLEFNFERMDEGDYELTVTNTGDFKCSYKKISIKNKFITDTIVQFSAGYVFPVALYDGEIEKFAEKKFFPISFTTRFSVIGEVLGKTHLGIGVWADYSKFKAQSHAYNFYGNDLNVILNLIYQKFLFKEKLKLDIHAGAGMALLFNMGFEYRLADFTSPDFKSLGLAIGGGFALQYYPLKHLYLELGADFVHAKFKDMTFGTFCPEFSVGVRF